MEEDCDFEYEFTPQMFEKLNKLIGKDIISRFSELLEEHEVTNQINVSTNEAGNVILSLSNPDLVYVFEEIILHTDALQQQNEDTSVKKPRKVVEELNRDILEYNLSYFEEHRAETVIALQAMEGMGKEYDGLAPLDKGILPFLDRLNSLKGTVVSHNCFGHLKDDWGLFFVNAGKYEENHAPYFLITLTKENEKFIPDIEEMIEEDFPGFETDVFYAGMDGQSVKSFSFNFDNDAFIHLSKSEAEKAQTLFCESVTNAFEKYIGPKKRKKQTITDSKSIIKPH